jgi:hypothetical protein
MLSENGIRGFRNPLTQDMVIDTTDKDKAENPIVLPVNTSWTRPIPNPATALAGKGICHPAEHASTTAKSNPLALPR